MRILITADPELPVPPDTYGGIERIVAFLAGRLTARGHDVTLFARPGSNVPCELVPWSGLDSFSRANTLRNMARLARYAAALRHAQYIVHSFARLAYLLPILTTRAPKIQSYQRHITPRSVHMGRLLGRGRLSFTACSRSCASHNFGRGDWSVIYNGVEPERYAFRAEVPSEAPLVFLGRVEPIKGAHHAIEIARRSGRKLVIAGNHAAAGPDLEYFERRVLPHCDGRRIEYIGPVNDAQKNTLLGGAAALLFPIEWEEPFGIVMAEALMCGTPVIGMRRGSVPEVVSHGETGFICDDVDQMIAAVDRIPALSRAACRKAAEHRFSADVIVTQYEELYRRQLAQA